MAGLSANVISRQRCLDRKTVRRYRERGLELLVYGPRKPCATGLDPFTAYLQERVAAHLGLTRARLLREQKERDYE
jgi:hypothetical protein